MNKIKIEIKHRLIGSVLFSYESENNDIKNTLEKATEEGAYLKGADLEGAVIGRNDKPNGYGDVKQLINDLEKKSNLSINEIHENHDCFTNLTRWANIWKNVIVIRKWTVREENKTEVKEMTVEEISNALGYEVKVVKGGNQ